LLKKYPEVRNKAKKIHPKPSIINTIVFLIILN